MRMSAALLRQPALQQHQARLQVVADVGQAERGIQAQLPVGEFGAALLRVVAQKLPQDRAGHALDQVVVAQEHAVVGREVAHLQRGAGPGRADARRGVPPR